MEQFYIYIVVFMLCLAVFDLIVGVSNDAVNFLTSAVGSQASSFKTIIIIASIGVFIGAVSSGGMLEIAKRGVFNPSFFSFHDIITIFIVVMICDILLLDVFNSLKLPTSTTITIVFELLGAALAVSFIKVYREDQTIVNWLEHINGSKASEMITAIFVSVAVAFVCGWLIQFIIRAIVTFNYKKNMRLAGSVYGALSIVIVVNFIIEVALKNSPLRSNTMVGYILDYALYVYLIVGLLAFIFFYLKSKSTEFDTFKVITLIGTFALAMAFASNDLVNFIGVPIAGFEAYQIWHVSNQPAKEFLMTAFSSTEEAGTNPIFLLLAGTIMIATLATSKKARNVIQTTVNLSKQSDGVERFKGNDLTRGLVKGITFLSSAILKLLPKSFLEVIERRYKIKKSNIISTTEVPQAFDFVRASTNLIVAAVLISLGTRFQLPLSTTYVSFMVIMGTSLADRAWNKDSAVYRVSGVFAVILGWFITAISALIISILCGYIAYQYELWGILGVFIFAATTIFLVNKYTNNELMLEVTVELPDQWFKKPLAEVQVELLEKTKIMSDAYNTYVVNLSDAVIKQDPKAIKDIAKRTKKQDETNFYYKATITNQIKSVKHKNISSGKALVEFYLQESEIISNAKLALDVAKNHVLNMHSPIDEDQERYLLKFVTLFQDFNVLFQQDIQDEEVRFTALTRQHEKIKKHVSQAVSNQIEGLMDDKYSFKNSQVYLDILVRHLDTSDLLLNMYVIATQDEEYWDF